MEDKPLVVITGITGYVGSQVCHSFLKNGEFRVRGTVRDTTNTKKMQPLIKAYGQEMFDTIELVEADLRDEESMIKAMAGAKFIVHTASPFPMEAPKNEDDLIKPAVQGTLACMKGGHANKVERIVITSSVVAIFATDKSKTHFTVEDWTDPTIARPYEKSKTLAEKAAWDFLAALPEEERFECVTINPGLVIGPNLNECNFTSGDIIRDFMTGKIPGCPKVKMPMVDVRDVA